MNELEKLQEKIKTCKKCRLHSSRTHAVPGEGAMDADVFIAGEAPGAEEDKLGSPFVGAAGRKLNEGLDLIGLDRKDVFITNLCKCRPPNNRNPEQDEIDTCSFYLYKQMALVQPEVIVPLGKFASQSILKSFDRSMKNMRGKIHQIYIKDTQGDEKWVKVFPMYHPAFILYQRQMADVFFNDFEMLKTLI